MLLNEVEPATGATVLARDPETLLGDFPMNDFYKERAIVTTVSPYDGSPEQVICTQDELNDTLTAAVAAGRLVRRVEPFWSMADEESACAADQSRDLEAIFG